MKKTLATVLVIVFLFPLFSNKSLAFWPIEEIQDSVNFKFPTATPTPIAIKKIDPNINLQLIPTIAPAAKLTVTPEPTLGTKLTVTPTPTASQLGGQATSEESNNEISPTQEATKTEGMVDNKPDLKTWFMGITMGLLALIIIIQLFPRKKTDQ